MHLLHKSRTKQQNAKLGRFFNIVMIFVFGLLLSSVICSYIASKLDLPFPEYTNIGIERSEFEGRTYQWIPKPSLSAVFTGDFQEQIDQWASDHIPFRNQLLLSNATLQRCGIKAANLFFNFDCYPTYFNSDQIETADMQHIAFISQSPTIEETTRLNNFAKNIDSLSSEYPDVQFVFYAVDDNRWSENNPSSKYVSDSCTNAFINSELWSRIKSPNISILINNDLSSENYFDYFLPTEHHWSFKGWSTAYNAIAEVLDWKEINQYPVISLDDYPSFGSTARLGLDLETSKYILEEYDVKFPNLIWEVEDEIIDEPGNKRDYLNGNAPHSGRGQYYLYDDYYGENYAEQVIINTESDNVETAIVVTDSQGKPLLNYIAQNYSSVFKINPVIQIADIKLRDLIDSTDCKEIIFILEPQALVNDKMAASHLFD